MLLKSLFLVALVAAQTTTNTTTTTTTDTTTTDTTTPTTTPTTVTTTVDTPTTLTTTVCPSSTSYCPSKCTEHHHHHYHTKTICTTINNTPCWLYVWPCPTATTSFITSTAYVAPTSAVAPACVPCTSYVTQTVNPPAVCTTMIFCDIVDQSENCVAQNNRLIEEIASEALRSGGNVYVNGQMVVFASGSSSSTASTGSVSGQDANDAAATNQGVPIAIAAIMGCLLFF
ncbi:hypothetical protein PSACC_02254 [Paramicrosporidium saccamoebae]|uniref:Uncharacterized protein n=1 Tax=Paramicrosporidium saccamoebae TaxID=1246581 RepID=A0A2H9TJK4_9FUNG|nr:hypothetical protein PSACC_02254 [Paramicrosporidium saccamoebae]